MNQGVEIVVKVNKQEDCFDISFLSYNDSVTIKAIPNITNRNPAEIQKKVRIMYENYALALTANPIRKSVRMMNYKRSYKLYQVQMDKHRKLLNAFNDKNVSAVEYNRMLEIYNKDLLDSISKSAVSIDNISRSLELTGFGTYNCDYFARIVNPIACSPNFINTVGNERMSICSITLVDLESNAYISVIKSEFKLSSGKSYWIFGQTKDKQIGFAVVTASKNNLKDIPMKIISGTTIQQLRNSLRY